MPRSETFASVPVERFGRLMITKSSADASGPEASRAMPGASSITRTSSRPKPLVISESEPERSTIASEGEPEETIARRKPDATESTPTRTSTTPAMPMTEDSADPRRSGIVRRLNAVSEATCTNQLINPFMMGGSRDQVTRRSASATPMRIACQAGSAAANTPSSATRNTPTMKSGMGK